jgi:hypothetical protein
MRVGHARASTLDQSPELQLLALTAPGCGRIFGEKAPGDRAEQGDSSEAVRPALGGFRMDIPALDRTVLQPSSPPLASDRDRLSPHPIIKIGQEPDAYQASDSGTAGSAARPAPLQ